MKDYCILTINPGSTSTKLAIFDKLKCVATETIQHSAAELADFTSIKAQFPYRLKLVEAFLKHSAWSVEQFDAVVGMGGAAYSLEGGTYLVDQQLADDTLAGVSGVQHPANLGPALAKFLADQAGIPAFIVNGPSMDEFQDLARLTGKKGVFRQSRLHALNLKETGYQFAKDHDLNYHQLNLIICHLGGGVSVSAHRNGRIIDGNDIAAGDGPMAPTRTGYLSVESVVNLAFSGKYSKKDLFDLNYKTGGFVDLFGTSDVREILAKVKLGDSKAILYWRGFIYQIAKEIGAMYSILHGKVDAILITGGIAHSQEIVTGLKDYCSSFAPIYVYPGEAEMKAMEMGAIRVLEQVEKVKHYTGRPVWSKFEF